MVPSLVPAYCSAKGAALSSLVFQKFGKNKRLPKTCVFRLKRTKENQNKKSLKSLLTKSTFMVYTKSCASADGSIAQLGEHLPYKQGVTGSSPVVPTIGPVVQLVRMPACHAGGQGFEPPPDRQFASVAQLVEQGTENPCVGGSSPL